MMRFGLTFFADDNNIFLFSFSSLQKAVMTPIISRMPFGSPKLEFLNPEHRAIFTPRIVKNMKILQRVFRVGITVHLNTRLRQLIEEVVAELPS